MKKVSLILILFMLTLLPCTAKTQSAKNIEDNSKSIVFVYHIPDDTDSVQENTDEKIIIEDNPSVITSDDVTADTSGNAEEIEDDDEEIEDYRIDDMYTDVLQGYAEYNEDEQDAITLDNLDTSSLKLEIKEPEKITQSAFSGLKSDSLKFESNKYSKYNAPEYSISPMSSTNYRKIGGFSAGTLYSQGIDYGELEQSSGVFSRYQYKKFAISTAYLKTVNTTNNNYNDNFYFSPELKLNDYFTLKEVLSADITKNRQKAEVVLSINPFGQKDSDRLKLELGASQTYYMDSATTKNQFKFSTSFKL